MTNGLMIMLRSECQLSVAENTAKTAADSYLIKRWKNSMPYVTKLN